MITLVTTTRDRALCFGLLEKWMARQSLKWDQWIVVNDGTEPYNYNLGQTVLKRNPGGDDLPSICENWLAVMPLVQSSRVVVVEDDDWYHPDYLAVMDDLLDHVQLAGVREALYYKLPLRKWMPLKNKDHATLSATAFRSHLLPLVERSCQTFKSVFIDMYLWAEASKEGTGLTCGLVDNRAADGRAYQVGMKMMPGAAGLGLGHGAEGQADSAFQKLRQWVGAEDCAVYSGLIPDTLHKSKS
jgi:hypothetical protein